TAKVLAPIMLIAIVAGLIANLSQIGFLITAEPLKFDLKKIDPVQGAKRIFSLRALVELLKSSSEIPCIGTITFAIIRMYKDDMMEIALTNADSALLFFGRMTIIMGIASALALLFLAVFDYAYQRYDYEKSIRMSKQDIKDEQKKNESEPQIKSKNKERQQQIRTRRIM